MTKQKSNVFDAFLNINRISDENGKWIITGYATTADLDVDDGYITEEALKGAEKDLLKYSTLLYNHDRHVELGKVLETKYLPEERALWIKALISKTVPDVWQKIKEGVLNKFSINGRALEWEEVMVKGMDKIITLIKSLSLFEASLVTVPADASSRTLAWYVERSIKNPNFKEDRSMSKKKDVNKETKDVGRDKERVEGLIDSVEQALNTEDMEIHAQAMRSVLDFLKSLLATDYSSDSERSAEGDIKKLVGDAVKEGIGDLSNNLSTLAETMKTFVEKSAENAEARVKAEEEVKAKAEEDAKRAAEEDEDENENKDNVTKSADNGELKRLSDAVDSLTKLVKDSVPVRRAEGAEDHKEDKRKEKDSVKEILKSEDYKKKDPVSRLKMYLSEITKEE